jgi:RNA polymerase primary sigma factor
MTLREVGERLGLTRERVRQLERQALQQLMEGA